MEMPDFFTNEAIFQNWSTSLKIDNSAKQNCDIWMKYNDYNDGYVIGVPAVAHCRNQNILGVPCNLPNIYELICIYTCSNELDKLDPTASSYPGYKIGNTAIDAKLNEGHTMTDSSGIAYFMFSSTEYNSQRVRRVGYTGYCQQYPKNGLGQIIPVLEI